MIPVFKLERDRSILILLISIHLSVHILWVALDRSSPAWDESAHLTNVLNFQQVINNISIFSADWWNTLWGQAPSYRAPFIYILTVPFFNIFGKSSNSGLLVNLIFIPTIALSTYYLAKRSVGSQIGLWAGGLCLMFPALVAVQLNYLLDYGIVAITTLTFLVLTLWKDATSNIQSWKWSLLFGILLGCLMLTKPTGFLFLLFPGCFIICSFIRYQNWLKLLQAGLTIVIAWLICGGWFSHNWLTIITSAISANAVGMAEGDPSGTTLNGWLYYAKLLPELISTPILITSIGCIAIWIFRRTKNNDYFQYKQVWWLFWYFVGIYSFCSLATNKDSRFILPILPVISIFIAYIINIFQTTWFRLLRWGTIGLHGMLLLIHLFLSVGIDIPQTRYSYVPKLETKSELSTRQMIKEIIKNQPYLKSNIGSLASTREINAGNLDFYGQANDFQVYAREFSGSFDEKQLIEKDIKALNWYAVQLGEFKHINKLIPIIERDPNLQLYKDWKTRDGSILKLYRRNNIPILVEPTAKNIRDVRLEKVIITPTSGLSINTTYQFSGNKDLLQNGLLLLNWQSKDLTWHHDHGIGMGELYFDKTKLSSFQVTEHLAMIPPEKLQLGEYKLTATYLNRKTGETFPLVVPAIEIKPATNHPAELDLITQLHQLGRLFAQGKIDPVFSEIAMLNQYDPIQDYLIQAQQAIKYRIARGEIDLNSRYTLALTQALQRQIDPLLDNLTQIVQQDSQNPSAWTYLGVVRLYNWQPKSAEMVFKKAEALPSPPPALYTLKIISAAFRFDLPQVWKRLHEVPK